VIRPDPPLDRARDAAVVGDPQAGDVRREGAVVASRRIGAVSRGPSLLQRTRWGLPGGGYKPAGETPEQAISREVAEELSLSLPAQAFIALDTVTTTLEGKRDSLTILRTIASDEEVSLSPELAEARWIDDMRQLGLEPVSRWLIAAVSHTS
jgi:ADP-ribose pyrophosphatase YjhB (NUDIX family)